MGSQPYPLGYFAGDDGVSPRLLVRVRTAFNGIADESAFSASLSAGGGLLVVPTFKMARGALPSIQLHSPADDAYIAQLVTSDMGAVTSSVTNPITGITTKIVQLRGFQEERLLEVPRWRLPFSAWAVAGGGVWSTSTTILGVK